MFNNKFYQHKNGLDMSSSISSFLAEIFMPPFENKLFFYRNHLNKSVHFWARYVEDNCVWGGTDKQLNLYLDFLNSF